MHAHVDSLIFKVSLERYEPFLNLMATAKEFYGQNLVGYEGYR